MSSGPPTSDLVANKRALRQEMRERRRALGADAVREAGLAICERVAADAVFTSCRTLGLFVADDGEPDLEPLFRHARAVGKTVLYPRCDHDGRLVFHPVDDLGALTAGRYGIPEPPPTSPCEPTARIDLVLAPCVAVDGAGRRLGRGAGWYDRSLPAPGGGPHTLGVIHSFQQVDSVPAGPADRRLDGIVSERALYWLDR